MNESLIAILDAIGDSMGDIESRSGIFLEGQESTSDGLLDLAFGPRHNIAIAANEAHCDLLVGLGIDGDLAGGLKGAFKDERLGDVVCVVFDEGLLDKKVEIVLRKLKIAAALDLIHESLGDAVGNGGNERAVLLGEDVVLGSLAGDEEVGEGFANGVGDVREGELFFGTGTGDGDFRNGIALGGGEDFAPGERSGGAGAAGDGFFEGLVFRER